MAANKNSGARRWVVPVACGAFALGMVGAAYASVPLYELFCQMTGYGGTTQRAEANSGRIGEREIVVRFDANASRDVPWTFAPNEREVAVRLGETRQISYHVRNDSDRRVTARATFNVTPDSAGVYFNKIACFCFNDQTLEPGQSVDMPVLFFVDPDIEETEELKGLPAITLSYTFFSSESEGGTVASVPEAQGAPAAPGAATGTNKL
ncbi:cytochrome c oxidase assembly protein [Aurantimonas sp. Leaf443]|uniref:cytochrome c oxidase assembly protein n=1 Tax=Aurantimonas sp. Leaf443 TaxID=1736378 RepID=UPI0006F70803|nr:cytochrome c oxidase assembly protein [Aurantimonas sp. Leaf443]KQT88071.1 cytochrome C oxidase assembly protein [Aurantimonas sp. Leaf443]